MRIRAEFATTYSAHRMAGGDEAIGIDIPVGVRAWAMPPGSPRATIGSPVEVTIVATDPEIDALKAARPGTVTNER